MGRTMFKWFSLGASAVLLVLMLLDTGAIVEHYLSYELGAVYLCLGAIAGFSLLAGMNFSAKPASRVLFSAVFLTFLRACYCSAAPRFISFSFLCRPPFSGIRCLSN